MFCNKGSNPDIVPLSSYHVECLVFRIFHNVDMITFKHSRSGINTFANRTFINVLHDIRHLSHWRIPKPKSFDLELVYKLAQFHGYIRQWLTLRWHKNVNDRICSTTVT